MGDKILVFNTDDLIVNTPDSKTEKELFYNEWGSTDPKTLEIFFEMDKFEKDNTFISSTIDVILLQQILPFVTPIIKEIPASLVSQKLKGFMKKNKYGEKGKYVKKQASIVKINDKTILLKPDHSLRCIFNGTIINVPKYSNIVVIGFKINNRINKKLSYYLHTYLYNRFSQPDGYRTSSIVDLFLSGSFSNYNFITGEHNKFATILRPGLLKNCVEFDDPRIKNIEVRTILNAVINMIQSANLFYDTNTRTIYNAIHSNTVDLLNQPQTQASLQTRPHQPQTQPQIHPQTPPQQQKNYNKTLEKLGKILNANLFYNDYTDVLLNIFNRGYYDQFSKLLATNDQDIYSIIKYKKEQDEDSNFINLRQKKQFDRDLKKTSKAKHILTEAEIIMVNNLYNAITAGDKVNIKKSLTALDKVGKTAKIICEHVLKHAKLLLENYSSNITKSQYIKKELIMNYGDQIEDGNFCKKCGEYLGEVYTDIVVLANNEYNSNSYDFLQSKIFREASYIINNFVEFGDIHMKNVIGIINNAVELLKGEIYTLQADVLKIKTLQHENIAATLNIYIYVYIFAFLSHLIYTNDNIYLKKDIFANNKSIYIMDGGRVIPDAPKSTKVAKPATPADMEKMLVKKAANTEANAKKLQKIITMALSILYKIKEKNILESKIITRESIKPLFLKAYRWIIGINYISLSSSNETYWDSNNPVVNYLVTGYENIIADIKSKVDNKSRDAYKQVLGRTKKQIEESMQKVDIYETLITPDKWVSTPKDYVTDSLRMFHEFISGKLYLKDSSNEKDNLLLQGFYNKYQHIKKMELELQNSAKYRDISIMYRLPNQKTVYTNASAKFKQCENNCGVFIYRKLNKNATFSKESEEISPKEVLDWIETKDYKKLEEFKYWVLTEIKCKCGKESKGLNKEQKIKKEQELKNLAPFFDFYELKCPEGDLHEIDIAQKCKKCEMDKLAGFDIKYYNKYAKKYKDLKQLEYQTLSRNSGASTGSKSESLLTTFPKWKQDVSIITKASKALSIPVFIITNLGLYENQEYKADIADIKIANPVESMNNKKRNNTLYDYYLYIVRNYYLLKNSEFVTRLPIFIKDFISQFSNVGLSKKLAEINKNFIPMYEFYKHTLKPEVLTNFLIESITNTLLKIVDTFKKNSLEKMGIAYAKLLFTNILEFEKKLTKFDIRKIIGKVKVAEFIRSELGNAVAYEIDNGGNEDIDEMIIDEDNEDTGGLDDIIEFGSVEKNRSTIDQDPYSNSKDDGIDEESRDIFSIKDLDIEYNEDNLYPDVEYRIS